MRRLLVFSQKLQEARYPGLIPSELEEESVPSDPKKQSGLNYTVTTVIQEPHSGHQAFKQLLCRAICDVNRQLRKTQALGGKNLRYKTITKNKEEKQKPHAERRKL